MRYGTALQFAVLVAAVVGPTAGCSCSSSHSVDAGADGSVEDALASDAYDRWCNSVGVVPCGMCFTSGYDMDCVCEGGANLGTYVACTEAGDCAVFLSGCIPIEYTVCDDDNYPDHPGLRDRCAVFCSGGASSSSACTGIGDLDAGT